MIKILQFRQRISLQVQKLQTNQTPKSLDLLYPIMCQSQSFQRSQVLQILYFADVVERQPELS